MKILSRALSLAMLFGIASNASAGTWSVAPDPARIGTAPGSVSEPISIIYTGGSGATESAQVDYDFDESSFTVQITPGSSGSCFDVLVMGNRFLRGITQSNPTNPTAPQVSCVVTFTSLAQNSIGSTGPEFTFAPSNAVCVDNNGTRLPCAAGGPIRLDVALGSQGSAAAVPALGRSGLAMLVALLAAVGMLAFPRHRRATD